jgi:hypothetical protein
MRPTALRLLIAAVLFVSWIGYLAYQVATRPIRATPEGPRPLVLSRPQFLLSPLHVLAVVPSNEDPVEVEVKEVLFQKDGTVKVGDTLKVINISKARPPHVPQKDPTPPDDWTRPGTYLLPLQPIGRGEYEVVTIPDSTHSPGRHFDLTNPPRIYPNTPAALAQYHQLPKPE